jgi:hypothetical protein
MNTKTILITGGTTGIGLATAQLLSGESLGIAPSDDDFCALGTPRPATGADRSLLKYQTPEEILLVKT